MPQQLRLLSWNVNGLRAVYKKGFVEWVRREDPDILCTQEVRAEFEQLPDELRQLDGYHTYYSFGQRKGYSGVGLFSREAPTTVHHGIGVEQYDNEGRIIVGDYERFVLFGVYFPNGSSSRERLDYKLGFYDAFLERVTELRRQGRSVIICGDVNTAHTDIDLARPDRNENHSGFLPQERDWIDRLLKSGFVDTLRMFTTEGGHYSYWDFKTFARRRNVGWRIDYIFVSDDLRDNVTAAFIQSDVMGSDHAPTGIELEFP